MAPTHPQPHRTVHSNHSPHHTAQVLEYRNLRTSAYSLLRSLLGDFDLGQLVGAQYLLGIVMFSMFVAVAILVVLNVLM